MAGHRADPERAVARLEAHRALGRRAGRRPRARAGGVGARAVAVAAVADHPPHAGAEAVRGQSAIDEGDVVSLAKKLLDDEYIEGEQFRELISRSGS